MVEEKQYDSSELIFTTESSNIATEAADVRSIIQDNQNEAQFLPTKFRIEVESCPKQFIFEAPNNVVLQKWMATIYSNWSAGAATKDRNFKQRLI